MTNSWDAHENSIIISKFFVLQQDPLYIISARGLGTGLLLLSRLWDPLVACCLLTASFICFQVYGAFIHLKNTLFNNFGMGLNIHG